MKKRKYVKFRHRLVYALVKPFFIVYSYFKYGYTFKKCKAMKKRPCLVLYNHQTGFDQFFVALAFYQVVYFVATEDIASMGFISRLLAYLVSPISFKKSTQDMRAVKECLWYAKENASLAIAPEGNRTYSGKTENIKPSIAKLAKALNYPIVFFQLHGGYGIQPRWSNKVRKGKMTGKVVTILEPNDYKEMSTDELYQVIKNNLDVNESSSFYPYYTKKQAEYLERLLYVCPNCGFTKFYSHNNIIKCLSCNDEWIYNQHLGFEQSNKISKFKNVNEWYEYQKKYLCNLDINKLNDEVIFKDTINFSLVIAYRKKQLLIKNGNLLLYKDHLIINTNDDEYIFNLNEIEATSVLGKNKMNIYQDDMIYQIKGDKRFNAIKYVNYFYYYMNNQKGVNHDWQQFLGL